MKIVTKKKFQEETDLERYFINESNNPLAFAFTGKIGAHPDIRSELVPKDQIDTQIETLLDYSRTGKTSVYIHVPFCETYCLYCGFYNQPYRKEESRIFTDLLIKEILLWEGREVISSSPINAIYFGGGTPTALEPDDLKRILETLNSTMPLANDCEITIEGRLSNFERDKIEACLAGGVNRFSIGVQTFNTDIRKSMGRISTQEEIIENLNRLTSYNQGSVVLDIIYGFPNQSMEIWEEDLAIAKSLNIDGFDCYQLQIFGMTPLGKKISEGKFAAGADIPTQSKMFAKAVDTLEEAFYHRISINHWSRTTRERNFYNQFAKSGADCLAFGAGAGGNINGYTFMVERDYHKWKESVADGKKPIMMTMIPPIYYKLYKSITEFMDQGWLNIAIIKREHNIDIKNILDPILTQWKKAGIIEDAGENMRLTLAGQFWQVNLSQLLIEYLKLTLEPKN